MLLTPCITILGWQLCLSQTISDGLERVTYHAGRSCTDSLAHRKTKGFPAHTPGGLASSTRG